MKRAIICLVILFTIAFIPNQSYAFDVNDPDGACVLTPIEFTITDDISK